MADASDLTARVKARPRAVAAAITIVGYALVMNAFEQVVPLFPPITEPTVRLFSSVIVVINAATLTALLAGVYFITNRQVDRHRTAMLSAVALEGVFLLLYLWKVGGGGELYIQASGTFRLAYLAILAVHLVCSALAVPAVVYAVLLGLTHSPSELAETSHARIGRIAVLVWSISLALGIVTSAMLRLAGSELRPVAIVLF
jgi:putative membrane protein